MENCYKNFARIYDRLMGEVDYDAWAGYLNLLLQKYSEGANRICECACGTGSITVRLKKMGYNITGVDISREMLEVASKNAREAGQSIPFVCMDMQKLVLHREHDAVVCCCDGVNYLTSKSAVERFFNSAFSSIKSGGVLLFDVSSAYKLEKIIGCNTFAEDDGKGAYIWKNMYDEKSSLTEMNLSFFEKQGESFVKFTEHHIQRAHKTSELVQLLEKVGFININVFDAFTLNEPKIDSERLQFAAVKPRQV